MCCCRCAVHILFVHSLLPASQGDSDNLTGWFTRQISLWRCRKKRLRPSLCKWLLLHPFISITSHQNSSPTEVATVPLAIKIMLGHAMVMCYSAVADKSGGSGSGNNDNSWVVNLERCRWNRRFDFSRKLRAGLVYMFLYETSCKISNGETVSSHLCLLYQFLGYTQP